MKQEFLIDFLLWALSVCFVFSGAEKITTVAGNDGIYVHKAESLIRLKIFQYDEKLLKSKKKTQKLKLTFFNSSTFWKIENLKFKIQNQFSEFLTDD